MFPLECLWCWANSFLNNVSRNELLSNSHDLLNKLSRHMTSCLWFLEQLRNRLWMFPYPVLLLVLHAIRRTNGLLLALQLPGWTIRRTNSEGFFFALFPDPTKVRQSPRTRGRTWERTRAHPRRLPMDSAIGWPTTMMLGRWWRRRKVRSGSTCARNAPSGTRRGSAELCRCWWCTGSRDWHPLTPS